MSSSVAELPKVTGTCPDRDRGGPPRRPLQQVVAADRRPHGRRAPRPPARSRPALRPSSSPATRRLPDAPGARRARRVLLDRGHGLAARPDDVWSTTTSPGAVPRCSRAPSTRRSTRTAATTSRWSAGTPIPSARSAASRRPATSTRSRTSATRRRLDARLRHRHHPRRSSVRRVYDLPVRQPSRTAPSCAQLQGRSPYRGGSLFVPDLPNRSTAIYR